LKHVEEYNILILKQSKCAPSWSLSKLLHMRAWFVRETFTSYSKHVGGHCTYNCTVMRRLTKGIRSDKCVVRRFRRCANVIECTYTNLDSTAYYRGADKSLDRPD